MMNEEDDDARRRVDAIKGQIDNGEFGEALRSGHHVPQNDARFKALLKRLEDAEKSRK